LLHAFLTLALDGDVVSFTPWPLNPGEGALCTHWMGGWVGSGVGLDAVVKRKIPSFPWSSST